MSRFDVFQMAQRHQSEGNTFLPFGLDKDNAAKELRRFADAIQNGEVLLQSASSEYKVKHDDFAFCEIKILFAAHEKKP